MKYKTTKSNWNTVQSQLKRFIKKLDKYGFSYTFKEGETSIETVTVFNVDPVTQEKYEVGHHPAEVISFEFECETLKLGSWVPVAIIKHNEYEDPDHNKINKVTAVNGARIKEEWYHIDPKCEHCHSNRRRNTTVILQSTETGEFKQVGSTCADEFTGVNALDVINSYLFVSEVLNEEPSVGLGYFEQYPKEFKYCETVNYLAWCIKDIEDRGYRKWSDYGPCNANSYEDTTKYVAFMKSFKKESIEPAYIQKAEKMIEDFSKHSNMDVFYQDIDECLREKYSGVSGFVAYAPLAHEKMMKKVAEEAEKVAVFGKLEYFGEVKDKIEVEAKLVNSSYFDTMFGRMGVYTFNDADNHQFVWFTQSCGVEDYEGEWVTLKGTVKEHKEYQGAKQTVLTRCNVTKA